MRILHVIPQFPYFGGGTVVGGHASCVLSLALAQHEAGENVSILSYIEGQKGPRRIEGGPLVVSLFANAKTRTFRFGLRFLKAAVHWIERNGANFDVIHVHSGFADYLMVSAALKMRSGKPTIHTLYCPIPRSQGRWNCFGARTLLIHCARRLDWVGGISQNVRDSMFSYGIRSASVVRPALDLERFNKHSELSTIRSSFGLAPDDLVVLFVGNAKPQKNALGVLRAMAKVRNRYTKAVLVITTELKHSSSDSDLNKLAEEVRRLGLQRIIQLGIVSDMPGLMAACDVLVAPFLNTQGPSDYFMAALEAMASGKPVVVSDVGGMREVVSDDVGRLVDPANTEDIAAALCALLGDKALRLSTGSKARRLVQNLFDPKNVVATYRDIYQRSAT